MKRSFLAIAVALVTGGSALAAGNPQSTGLTHTQSEARRTLATLVVRHEDSRCLQTAADNLTALPGLRRVAVREGALQATFASSAWPPRRRARCGRASRPPVSRLRPPRRHLHRDGRKTRLSRRAGTPRGGCRLVTTPSVPRYGSARRAPVSVQGFDV